MKKSLRLYFLFVLFLIGGIVRVYFTLTSNGGDLQALPFSDERAYYLEGAKIIKEQGIISFFTSARSAWNGPLNVLYIAALNLNIPVVKILNGLFLLVCTGLLTFVLIRRNEIKGAVIAFILISLHWPLLHFGATILTEATFISCIMIMFYLISTDDSSRSRWLYIGLACGIATLIRPTLQMFPFFLGGVLLLIKILKGRWYLNQYNYTKFLLGFSVLVAPVIIKNYYYFDKPVIANGFGAVLYLGNDLRRDGDEPIYSGFDFDTPRYTAPFTHLDFDGDKALMVQALINISKDPVNILILTGKKIFRLFLGNPMHYYFPTGELFAFLNSNSGWGGFFRIWELIFNSVVFVGALISLFYFRDMFVFRFISICFIFYIWSLHTVSFAIPRLGLPAYPIMAFWCGRLLGDIHALRRWGLILLFSSVFIILGISFYHRWIPVGVVNNDYTGYFQEIKELSLENSRQNELTTCGEYLCITGSDPSVVWNIDPLATHRNQVIFVNIDVISELNPEDILKTEMQLFWASSGKPDEFTEGDSIKFPIVVGGGSRIYRVVPGLSSQWQAAQKVSGIRLDFPDNKIGYKARIASIKIME